MCNGCGDGCGILQCLSNTCDQPMTLGGCDAMRTHSAAAVSVVGACCAPSAGVHSQPGPQGKGLHPQKASCRCTPTCMLPHGVPCIALAAANATCIPCRTTACTTPLRLAPPTLTPPPSLLPYVCCPSGLIQVSAATRALLPDWLALEPTGGVEVKGKGVMQTFLFQPTA